MQSKSFTIVSKGHSHNRKNMDVDKSAIPQNNKFKTLSNEVYLHVSMDINQSRSKNHTDGISCCTIFLINHFYTNLMKNGSI